MSPDAPEVVKSGRVDIASLSPPPSVTPLLMPSVITGAVTCEAALGLLPPKLGLAPSSDSPAAQATSTAREVRTTKRGKCAIVA